MTTIRLKNFDAGEVEVDCSDIWDGAVHVCLTWVAPEDGWANSTGADISPREARRIAKALLKAADEVEKGE